MPGGTAGMNPIYCVWVAGALLAVGHQWGFMAAVCAAIAGTVGYLLGAERQ